MPNLARAIRLVAFLLVATGIVLFGIAVATGERVNHSGFVPGAALSLLVMAIGGLGFRAADNLHDGRYGRLTIVLALTLWFGISTYLVIWGLAPGSLRDAPMGVWIAGFLILGFLGTLCAAVVVLVIAPVSWAVDWLADRIPSLRRQDVASKIRRQMRGPR